MHESDGGMLAAALVALLLTASMFSYAAKRIYYWLKKPRRGRVRLTLRERGMTQKQARQEFINQMAGGVFSDALEDMAVCGLLEEKEFLHLQEKLGRCFGLWEYAPNNLKDQKALKEALKAKRDLTKEEKSGLEKFREAIAAKLASRQPA